MSDNTMNKDAWVLLFREIGLSDAQMQQWHRAFERQYPAQHQAFLEWLGISPEDISDIRSL